MIEYIKAQKEANEAVINNTFTLDFPNSKGDLYLLKNSEFSWIKHDSVLKLNDIRTVSINRIQYQYSGNIDPTTDTYKSIETLVLKKKICRISS